MDNKASISTVILVLLVLLTLVSLSASAYLYFSFNSFKTKSEETFVKKGIYDGWHTYTKEEIPVTIKYPADWILKENLPYYAKEENDDSLYLTVKSVPGEKGDSASFVNIMRYSDSDIQFNEISQLSEFLTKLSDEYSSEGSLIADFNCDKENIIKKWGVDTIKCTYSEDEVGDLESYYFIFSDLYKDCIYSITYPVVEGFDSENVEKVLDSIVLGTK